MDRPAQAEAYARADFAAVDSAFVDRLLGLLGSVERALIADLGCGPADIAMTPVDPVNGYLDGTP